MANTLKLPHFKSLDVLRWVVAVIVVFHHLVSYASSFDKQFSIDSIINFNYPGHLCVLVFFILSGYVIRFNTPAITNRSDMALYLKKRAVRIYPIYFVVLTFAYVISGVDTISVYLSNLFFLGVPLKNLLIADAPVWSLSYEVAYYLLFVPIAFYKVDLRKLAIGSTIVSTLLLSSLCVVHVNPLLTGYIIGFAFWIIGAAIADASVGERAGRMPDSKVLGLFLLIFCMQNFNPVLPFMKMAHLRWLTYPGSPDFQQYITATDLFYLPVLVALICGMTRCKFRFTNLAAYGTIGILFVRVASIVKIYGINYMMQNHQVLPMLFLCLATLLYLCNFEFGVRVRQAILKTVGMSNISYAIYILHLPLICCFVYWAPATTQLFSIKVLAFLGVLLFLSYVLELKFQPVVRRFFFPKKKG